MSKIISKFENVDLSGEKRAITSKNGNTFEQVIINKIMKIIIESNYELNPIIAKQKSNSILFDVKKDNKHIAWFGSQNKLFEILNKDNNWVKKGCEAPKQNIKSIWSKDLKPDLFFFDDINHKLIIVELKFQRTDGSVDEKIQTAVYKKEMWNKLFSQYGINVEYKYIMGTFEFWTKINKNKNVQKYKDLFEWLKQNKIAYFLDEDPLNKYTINDFINY